LTQHEEGASNWVASVDGEEGTFVSIDVAVVEGTLATLMRPLKVETP
jgi:hypothetical protein